MKEKKIKKDGWWSRKKISQKVMFCISMLLLALSVFTIVVLMDIRRFFNDELADAVYGEGISSGWAAIGHAMSSSVINWILTAIVVFVGICVVFVFNFFTHLFDNGTRKAKTVSSLIRSLIKYISIIAMVCIILAIWGVDIIGIMAGVGVITLIIGLGCQSLIQDVISGLFIVFDDYFAAGDTVIIDGFRGTIVEVGLKTTKLEDFGGNIKSITNSSITTVVNMSRLRSVAPVKLAVSYNEDVERVEALIIKETEELKTKIPNIVEGPWYKGIDSISDSSINFLVFAFVKEEDRFQVTRDLNREFYLLFKKNNIQIPYNQVTVNPQDELVRPKASSEQKELAQQEQNNLRGINQVKVKKNRRVSNVVKESFEKTKRDMQDF